MQAFLQKPPPRGRHFLGFDERMLDVPAMRARRGEVNFVSRNTFQCVLAGVRGGEP